MDIKQLEIEGVLLLKPKLFWDERGHFCEVFNERMLKECSYSVDIRVSGDGGLRFVQDNQSRSKAGVLRGLHFQTGHKAQTKLVRAVRGKIFDVVVDLRPKSNSFGKWLGVVLSDENKEMLLVPKGFAHGFCSLVDDTEVLYKVDEYYSPTSEGGLKWDDSSLGIKWPIDNPIVSDRDNRWSLLKDLGENPVGL